MILRPLSFAFGALFLASSAQALTFTADSINAIPPTDFNWSGELSLPKFNSQLGTLTGVKVELFGSLLSEVGVESLDTMKPSDVFVELRAKVSLTLPDASLLLTTPTQTWTRNATPFDGSLDFGGSSGATYLLSSRNAVVQSETRSFTGAADLARFIGLDLLLLPVSASDSFEATSPGSLAALYIGQAGAWATVTYTYTAPIPEPGTWALMLAGLAATGFMARRRRAR